MKRSPIWIALYSHAWQRLRGLRVWAGEPVGRVDQGAFGAIASSEREATIEECARVCEMNGDAKCDACALCIRGLLK